MEKRNLIIYWIATALLAFGMLASGIQQVMLTPAMKELVSKLGYPAYLLVILGVWKILGVIAILVPKFKLLKEWAYAGFFFTMIGALISHLATGDDGIRKYWARLCKLFLLSCHGILGLRIEKLLRRINK